MPGTECLDRLKIICSTPRPVQQRSNRIFLPENMAVMISVGNGDVEKTAISEYINAGAQARIDA